MSKVNVTPCQKYSGHSQHYALKQVIGKGAYGVVYKAINKATNQFIAIKTIQFDNDEELNEHMLEIDLLKNLKHENIVKYHGFIQKSHELFILLEYCSKGSLRDLLKNIGTFSDNGCKKYVKQTLQGLKYLHEQGVIHRDIKAANLLLTEENIVKLADFGVSTRINNIAMTYAGSPNWMSPEVMLGQGATTVSDIWSLGATVVELLTGNPPFHNLVNEAACYAIVNDTYYPPESFDDECKSFINLCLQKNVFKRPSAHNLLQHNWLKSTTLSVNKLSKYKENDMLSHNWDDDFLEVNMSPSKKPYANNSDNYLNLLKLGQCDLIFRESCNDTIVKLMFQLSQNLPENIQLISEFLSYDKNQNNSIVKKQFVTLGGLIYILPYEDLIVQEFIEEIPALVQCGILFSVGKLRNAKLVIAIVHHLYSIFSFDHWYKWCSTLSNLQDFIFQELINENKASENILLYLSSADNYSLNIEALTLVPLKTPRIKYIIFKAINNVLKRKPNLFIESSTTLPAIDSEILPDNFVDWMIKYIPVYESSNGLKRIFLELCYNSAHLNSLRLKELIEEEIFLKFIYSLVVEMKEKSLWQICCNICVELSIVLTNKSFPYIFKIALYLIKESDLIISIVELILNVFLFAIRENYHFSQTHGSIIIDEKLVLKRLDLLNLFYEETQHFGNFITKFTKLCSLTPCEIVCYEIVIDPRFIQRTKDLFDLYKASLIIQIDFLKFLKIILTKSLEFVPKTQNPNITTEKILNNAIKNNIPINNMEASKIVFDLSHFLVRNWSKESSYNAGVDSILIHQLCNDIKCLCSKPIDDSRFVVPKLKSRA